MFKISNLVYTADAFPVSADLLSQLRINPQKTHKDRVNKTPKYQRPTRRFRAGVFRGTKATVLLYPNGRAVIVGAKTKRAFRKTTVQCFIHLGIGLSNYRLVNIAGYARLNRRLNLPFLSLTIPKAIYIPEEHCGLLFYIGRVSVIAYHTGVLMFCGCRSNAEFRYVKYKLDKMFINSRN